MTRSVDIVDRIALWKQAFDAVREEVTPPKMRDILAEMSEVEGVAQLSSYMQLANGVMANDRTAAEVASRLVIGVRPLSGDGPE